MLSIGQPNDKTVTLRMDRLTDDSARSVRKDVHRRLAHLGELSQQDINADTAQALAVAIFETINSAPESVLRKLTGVQRAAKATVLITVSSRVATAIIGERGKLGRFEDLYSSYGAYAPALIAPRDGLPVAFAIKNALFGGISSCTVKNTYAFDIGENVSAYIAQFTQHIERADQPRISYVIPFGFLFGFGDRVRRDLFPEIVSGLWARAAANNQLAASR